MADDVPSVAPWEFDARTRATLPRVLLSLAADKNVRASDRVKAALALVAMNEQNSQIAAAADRAASRGPAGDATPAVRIDVSADGIELLRAGFLGRLAAAGRAPGVGGPADVG